MTKIEKIRFKKKRIGQIRKDSPNMEWKEKKKDIFKDKGLKMRIIRDVIRANKKRIK